MDLRALQPERRASRFRPSEQIAKNANCFLSRFSFRRPAIRVAQFPHECNRQSRDDRPPDFSTGHANTEWQTCLLGHNWCCKLGRRVPPTHGRRHTNPATRRPPARAAFRASRSSGITPPAFHTGRARFPIPAGRWIPLRKRRSMLPKVVINDVAVSISASAEEAVRLKFNPSALNDVAQLKTLAAAFISECDRIATAIPDAGRSLAVAKTNMQTASMWAVLGATTGAP